MGLRNLTPQEYFCASTCPGIYEITPGEFGCVAGTCPSIHDFQDSYLIIGEQINPKKVGLERKVGKGEVLIKIKKEIIDNKKQSP